MAINLHHNYTDHKQTVSFVNLRHCHANCGSLPKVTGQGETVFVHSGHSYANLMTFNDFKAAIKTAFNSLFNI